MQTELQNGFDKDKVIADLQAKLEIMVNNGNTSEPLLQPPPSVEPTSSLPPAPAQPPTDQRTSTDKSLNQTRQYFLNKSRDRSPEIADALAVSDDSESDDENEKSDLQFAPNQSKLSSYQNYKRRSNAKKTEFSKVSFQHDILKLHFTHG